MKKFKDLGFGDKFILRDDTIVSDAKNSPIHLRIKVRGEHNKPISIDLSTDKCRPLKINDDKAVFPILG